MKKLAVCCLLCLWMLLSPALAVPAYAQGSDGDPFTHLQIGSNRYERQVNAVAQDALGFIWFGGSDGLNRYDGYELRTFQYDPEDPGSISSNAISDIYSDSSGALWVGTQGGLNRYASGSETFERFLHDPDDPASLSNNQVEVIQEDAGGMLWVGTHGGLNRFDRATGTFERVVLDAEDPSGTASSQVYALEAGANGTLWVGTYGGGLYALGTRDGEIIHYPARPGEPGGLTSGLVMSLSEDRRGELWVGTWDGGLNRLDPKTAEFTAYRSDPDDPTSLSSDAVVGLWEDRKGALWAATWTGGLNRLDPQTGEFARFQKDADPDSLSHNTLFDLYEDANGLLWIATVEGLDYYDPLRKPFKSYTSDPNNANSLGDRHVLATLKDRSGAIWVGTPAGLDRIDGEKITHYRHDPDDPESLGANFVFALAEDPSGAAGNGALWVGTWSGLDRFDPQTGKFTHFSHDPVDPTSLSENTIYSLFFDTDGVLWVGTYGGLNRFDADTGSFTRFVHDPEDPESIGANPVFAIAQDSTGLLWVGTQGGGLNRLMRETGKFRRYVNDPEDPESIGADSVWSILPDHRGDLWVGTSAGLNHFDPLLGRFDRQGDQPGLPASSVNGILADDFGGLWLTTDRGLYSYDPDNNLVAVYDKSDGLISDDFERKGYSRAAGGELLLGSTHGLIVFDPRRIRANPQAPQVVITGLELNNASVPIEPGSVLPQSILQTTELDLPYSSRAITFEFAGLGFRAPQGYHYRYRLDGFDNRWYEAGSDRRRVTYTNLDPGWYVFRVTGANGDGVWSDAETAIRLRVIPPWWDTFWFRALLVAASLLFGLVIFRWSTNSIRRRNRWLENAVAERTDSLEAANQELQTEIAARQRTEDELRLSEARYRTIFDTTGAATAILGPDGTILLANNRYAQLCGCPREELEGSSKWTRFLHPEDAGRVVAFRQEYRDGREGSSPGPADYEYRIVDLLGGEHHVLGMAAAIPGTEWVVESLLDITPRRALEQTLQHQNERFRLVWEGAGDAFVLVDPDGVVVAANPAFYELFLLEDEKVVGRHFNEFVSLSNLETVTEVFRLAQSGAQSMRLERDLTRADGTPIVVEGLINQLGQDSERPQVLGLLRDITERKRAADALQLARDQLATLLAISQNLVSTLDLELLFDLILDRITAVVPYEGAAVLGVDHNRIEPLLCRSEVLRELLELPGSRLADNPLLRHLLTSKEVLYIEDMQALDAYEQRFAGRLERWQIFRAVYRTWLVLPLVIKGELIGCLVFTHSQPGAFDEQRRTLAQAFANQAAIAMENARLYLQAQDAAVASERMRLARDLHDSVTQAIYSISLFGEATRLAIAAGKSNVVAENIDEILQIAREATTELRVLIFELHPPILAEIGLEAAIKSRLDSVETRVGMDAQLEVDGDLRLSPQVEAELFRVAQEALTNVSKHSQASQVRVRLELCQDRVRLEISDNGIGFDPSQEEHSAGMGLRSLRERVQRIGGVLEIESASGRGTTVAVEIRSPVLKGASARGA